MKIQNEPSAQGKGRMQHQRLRCPCPIKSFHSMFKKRNVKDTQAICQYIHEQVTFPSVVTLHEYLASIFWQVPYLQLRHHPLQTSVKQWQVTYFCGWIQQVNENWFASICKRTNSFVEDDKGFGPVLLIFFHAFFDFNDKL